jgi:hypothetical protein
MPELTFDEDAHIYRYRGKVVKSVTQILKEEGFMNSSYWGESSAEAGKFRHLACHLYDIGDLAEDNLDEDIRPYLDAYVQFKSETGFTVSESEIPHYQSVWDYAGTPDKVGRFPNHTIDSIIDIKTGLLQAWTALQSTAYELFFNTPMRRYALELRGDATYRLTEYKDREDRNVWLAALKINRWKEMHNARISNSN